MNWGINALGQGNRANATIGRASQLIIRNVGGGGPGEMDRSTLGGPGKYTFCFAEDETDPSWQPLSASQASKNGAKCGNAFSRRWIQGFIDQRSRTPEELTRSLAMALGAVGHPKLAEFTTALLVLSPEHYRIYVMPVGTAPSSRNNCTTRCFARAAIWCRARREWERESNRDGRTRWSYRTSRGRSAALFRDLD